MKRHRIAVIVVAIALAVVGAAIGTTADMLSCSALAIGAIVAPYVRRIGIAVPLTMCVAIVPSCGTQPQTSPTAVGNVIFIAGKDATGKGVDSSGDQKATSKQDPSTSATITPSAIPK